MVKLDSTKVTCKCLTEEFTFTTTNEVSPLEVTIGQDRAIKAIEVALNMKTKGFNLYIAGPRGVGKTSTIKSLLTNRAPKEPVPPDIVYVFNFKSPESPKPLILKAGLGKILSQEMTNFTKELKNNITQIFETDDYERRKSEITHKARAEKEAVINQVQNLAKDEGFALQITPQGVFTMPMKNGTPLSPEEYQSLPEEDKKVWETKNKKVVEEINRTLRTSKRIEREALLELEKLDIELVKFLLANLSSEMKSLFSNEPKILNYIKEVEDDILSNINELKTPKEILSQPPSSFPIITTDPYAKYQINVIIDNSSTEGAPIIFENNPTYYNLIGKIEFKSQFGVTTTSFDLIKSGSLLKANGGYLVIQVLDILKNPYAWEALKKSLQNNEVKIENIGEQLRMDPVVTLNPESIPLFNCKVILIGSLQYYYLLYNYDEDFRKFFKIRADFDTEMDRNYNSISKHVSFISSRVKEESLNPFDRESAGIIVDYGSRLAENQKKLSTRFSDIADLISEANYWSMQENNQIVEQTHVIKALQEKVYRSNLIEEKIKELINEDSILLDITGSKVGQVNGLSTLSLGDYSFGKPSKITASVSLGTKGIINIEREVAMSGPIHSKGVLILTGFLRDKFARTHPLSLTSSLVFEQLYEGVEGDSASSAELYALLSAIASVPLKQNLAVTGSVNQKGEIQPVGGVTRKVEGFYDICKAKGLTGDQGVIIPIQNINNLVLRNDVVKAIEENKFHIYAIENISEGIELLTSMKAGIKDDMGNYEEGSFYHLIEKQLIQMALDLKEYSKKKNTRVNTSRRRQLPHKP
ncbi:MAG: Lon protease [candidate division WS2 bacterium]|uniref:endopeptidase La n=1 Tax=Psychracetigena formicireducens TaxID=2986056 RepID=A0A9E2BIF3_PSYF1|nr:Lon protease [Candidatus Psychracetigena formicireducens]MBT9144730.1 Lon protease [Candidatus Psychracetigena formicireducens]